MMNHFTWFKVCFNTVRPAYNRTGLFSVADRLFFMQAFEGKDCWNREAFPLMTRFHSVRVPLKISFTVFICHLLGAARSVLWPGGLMTRVLFVVAVEIFLFVGASRLTEVHPAYPVSPQRLFVQL